MNGKIVAGLTAALFVLAAVSSFGVANAARHTAVYTIDNAAANSVLQFQAGPNGVLSRSGTFSTQGRGRELHSQARVP